MRRVIGPATTVLHFRHLLWSPAWPDDCAMALCTIPDATIIAAPPSDEKDVSLVVGYIGVDNRDVNWQIAMKRGELKDVSKEIRFGQLLRKVESPKASIRPKVEHSFHIVKNLFTIGKGGLQGGCKRTPHNRTRCSLWPT